MGKKVSKKDLISIVIPCHNEENMLDKCIKSFKKQTYTPVEIIVVDDGSSDNSVKIAKKHKVKVLRLGINSGQAIARNLGAFAASGKYVAEVDADAIYPKDWLEKMYYAIKKSKAIGSIYGYIKVYGASNSLTSRFWQYKRKATFFLRYQGKREIKGMWLFKKSLLKKIGFYDPEMVCGEDVDFSKRAEKAGYTIAWAKDTYIVHRDPSDFFTMMERLWWGAVNCKKFELKWGSSFKFKNLILLFIRNVFVSFTPFFLFLSLYNITWLLFAFLIFASEAILPILAISEWRLVAKFAIQNGDYLFLFVYPFILWFIARITGYGKMYSFLFK